MSTLKPYPAYKESDLHWLRKVPRGWDVERINNRSKMSIGWTPPTGDDSNFTGESLWANISDIGPKQLTTTAKRVSESAVRGSRMMPSPPGSLLFSFKLSVGQVSFAAVEMYTNEAIATFTPRKNLEMAYAYYAYPVFILENAGENIYGAKILNQERLSQSKVAFPPPGEQRAIADFLDRETAEIDAFVAESEKLITLLNERRAAVITQAVTKGLDPSAPMKDTGIEWLGQIPDHWEVQRLGNTVKEARNGAWGEEPQGGTTLRCVRVADFDRQKLTIHDRDVTFRAYKSAELSGRVLREGDLLLEKSGGGEKSPVGFVVRYDREEPAVCSNFVARVVLHLNMDSRFWAYVHRCLYAGRITERSVKQATGIQNLDQSSYFNERVAVPQYAEQRVIADFLDVQMAKIDEAIETAREAIALAKERRQALISAAVTGKIDVRSAA